MSEPLEWQAKDVFLNGCGLPQAWASQPQWCVLEIGFGLGLNFLATWAAWKADPQHPRLLHFVSTEAHPASADDVLRSTQTYPELLPFAQQLKRQFWGLLPGLHRLVFENGQVLLTLCIGDAKAVLREPTFYADSVYLNGFSPSCNPDILDVYTLKAVAKCCRRGTRLATGTLARHACDALAQCGFVVHQLHGEYKPAWHSKISISPPPRTPAHCIVIGSGLAGAAVAASLARRGWQVTVLDAASAPAAGASGLPAGVIAPHVSFDDSLLSRLSRSGLRAMLQQADALLEAGTDWCKSGVLERCIEHPRRLPAAWQAPNPLAQAASDWISPATPAQLAACGLPADTPALWHRQAGWIQPKQLIQAWLATPGVTWRGNAAVKQIKPLTPQGELWQTLNANGQELASAELIVLAAGYDSLALRQAAHPQGRTLALQAIRGQASWGLHTPGTQAAMPTHPVNGHGSLVPDVPFKGGLGWVTGSSFDRDNLDTTLREADQQHNFGKLQTLLPPAAQALAAQFDNGQAQGWSGIRCTAPGRLPTLGPLEESANMWACCGLGSRGLTFAALCAELLAAQLHGEPLPIEQRQADALLPQYDYE